MTAASKTLAMWLIALPSFPDNLASVHRVSGALGKLEVSSNSVMRGGRSIRRLARYIPRFRQRRLHVMLLKEHRYMSSDQYVHYGCAWSAPESWRNFDASPTLRFERSPLLGKLYTKNKSRFPENVEYGDIVSGLPVSPDSCRAVYCSHVLEHLSLESLRKALQNTHRILKSGGVFRFVLPDLEHLVTKYINTTSYDAAPVFMKETRLGREKEDRSLKGFIVSWLGHSEHLWMWDYKSIERELRSVGFVEIRRARFGDSPEPMFQEVEDKRRWSNCLGVECKK